MKITKAVLRVTTSLLCAVLVLNGLPLSAAGLEGAGHEAFLRGGKAIESALTSEKSPAVSKAIEETIPPAPAPAKTPAPQNTSSSSRLSPKMWGLLIGGFAASGIFIYKQATGPGASVKNCSTCSK
jgi:hypothetical protein